MSSQVTICFILLFIVFQCVVKAEETQSACSHTKLPHHWGFRGAGYHMQFDVEIPHVLSTLRIVLDLPRSFFFDAAEVEQLYHITTMDGRDVTAAYESLSFSSEHFFDIEAPVFRVPYRTNRVNIALKKSPNASLGVNASSVVLVLPIHARYEELDTQKSFSLYGFIYGTSFVERCVDAIRVSGTSANCSHADVAMKTYHATRDDAIVQPNCQRIPVGVLADLPMVYIGLMTLLSAGAGMVILSLLHA